MKTVTSFKGIAIPVLFTFCLSVFSTFLIAQNVFPETGPVGIGILNPDYPLHVEGSVLANNGWFRIRGDGGLLSENYGNRFFPHDARFWRLQSNRGLEVCNLDNERKGILAHDNNISFGFRDADGHWAFRMYKDSLTTFHINGGEKMRILADGRIGIGIHNPPRKLSVAGAVRASNLGDATNYTEIGHGGINGFLNTSGEGRLDFRHDGLNKMSLTSEGKLGIGTTTPLAKLDVAGKTKTQSLQITQGAGLGKVLTSDQSGNASWKAPLPDNDWSFSGNHIYRNTGNVGIGISQPSAKLHVGGSIKWGSTGAMLSTDQGASLELRGNGIPYIDFSNDPVTGFDMRMILLNDNWLSVEGGKVTFAGNVGIGTNNPQSKLAVNGSITAREVKVTNQGWADYVFEESYQLSPLEETAKFIETNKHLPGFPTAEEIEKNGGFELGTMVVEQQEKIEELFLHLIELNKEVKALRLENESLRAGILKN